MNRKINYIILTNNKLVRDKYSWASYEDKPLLEIYIQARDLIHKGHRLLNHPLAGSVKPNMNPYRSLLLTAEPEGGLDYSSLKVIENSIETVRKFLKDHQHPEWNEELLEDFRYIDLELLSSGLEK